MAAYNIEMEKGAGPCSADLYRVAFGDPAQNDKIVRDAQAALDEIVKSENPGGELALVNGPASLPVAVTLAHGLGHLYGALGVFDPKMGAYVVSVAHGGTYAVGDTIPAA